MTYDESAIAQRIITRTLSEILRNYLAHHASGLPRNGLEIGCGTGLLTRHLQSLCPSAHWVLNDIQEAGGLKQTAALFGMYPDGRLDKHTLGMLS